MPHTTCGVGLKSSLVCSEPHCMRQRTCEPFNVNQSECMTSNWFLHIFRTVATVDHHCERHDKKNTFAFSCCVDHARFRTRRCSTRDAQPSWSAVPRCFDAAARKGGKENPARRFHEQGISRQLSSCFCLACFSERREALWASFQTDWPCWQQAWQWVERWQWWRGARDSGNLSLWPPNHCRGPEGDPKIPKWNCKIWQHMLFQCCDLQTLTLLWFTEEVWSNTKQWSLKKCDELRMNLHGMQDNSSFELHNTLRLVWQLTGQTLCFHKQKCSWKITLARHYHVLPHTREPLKPNEHNLHLSQFFEEFDHHFSKCNCDWCFICKKNKAEWSMQSCVVATPPARWGGRSSNTIETPHVTHKNQKNNNGHTACWSQISWDQPRSSQSRC